MNRRVCQFGRRAAVPGLAVLYACLSMSPAMAHAILVASTPAIGGEVPAGHLSFDLRYNSRVDKQRSRLTLTWPDGHPVVLAIDSGGTPDVLTTATDVVAGNYTLRWQVLAVDGHITRGDVPFTARSSP